MASAPVALSWLLMLALGLPVRLIGSCVTPCSRWSDKVVWCSCRMGGSQSGFTNSQTLPGGTSPVKLRQLLKDDGLECLRVFLPGVSSMNMYQLTCQSQLCTTPGS